MRIHIIYTGGTIGMVPTEHGLAPGADLRGWLGRIVAGTQLEKRHMTFSQLDPLIELVQCHAGELAGHHRLCRRIATLPTRSWCCMAPIPWPIRPRRCPMP